MIHPHRQEPRSSYYIDRCGECLQPVDHEYLNRNGMCWDCSIRTFADFVEDHPSMRRAELMAEGRQSGLSDDRIKLILSLHHTYWGAE